MYVFLPLYDIYNRYNTDIHITIWKYLGLKTNLNVIIKQELMKAICSLICDLCHAKTHFVHFPLLSWLPSTYKHTSQNNSRWIVKWFERFLASNSQNTKQKTSRKQQLKKTENVKTQNQTSALTFCSRVYIVFGCGGS